MAKTGIAISVYDKFEEVKILSDIFKQNFEEDYVVCVCSFHPKAEKHLEYKNIDSVVTEPEIGYSPNMEGKKKDIHLTSRIMQSIKLACKECMSHGADYVMHLHADAWPLEEEKLIRIRQSMVENNRKMAVKGPETLKHPNGSMGSITDQFFLFETEYFEEKNFFEYNPLDLCPHKLLRDNLYSIILGRIGRSKVWLYSDRSQDEFWDGKKRNNWENNPKKTVPHIRPMMFNPEWGQVHINTEDFLDNHGERLQAYYLEKMELTEGPEISKFLEEYCDTQNILEELSEVERKLNFRMRFIGVFKPERYGYNRNFKHKKHVVEESYKFKFLRLIRNASRILYHKTHKIFFKLPYTFHILPEHKQTFQRDLQRQNYYIDSEWPKSLEKVYAGNIDLNRFPEKYKETWF